MLKKLGKHLILFIIGGIIYYCIELIWRGYSHWTMAVTGAICFILLGGLNEFFTWDMSLLKQCLYGALIVTIIEFIVGCILNLWLGMGIWDYSNTPLNILGQVCVPYTLLWIPLSGVAIIVDDWLRYWLFNEEKPHYKFINKKY